MKKDDDDDDQDTRLVSVPVREKLATVRSRSESAEREELIDALEQMTILRADMVQPIPHPLPIIRISYADAPEPQIWWGRWLKVRIETRGRCIWFARLSGLIQETRELFVFPLPDKLEQQMAVKALLNKDVRIAAIILSVPGRAASAERYFLH